MNEAETREADMNPVLLEFVEAWIGTFEAWKTLTIDNTNWNVFSQIESTQEISLTSLQEELPANGTFDLILACFPWGQSSAKWHFDGRIVQGPPNWLSILRCASHLRQTGYAIVLAEPNVIAQSRWEKFEQELNREGLYLHGVLKAPEKLLAQTNITPCFLVVARVPPTDLFVAELVEEGQASDVVVSFASKEPNTTLAEGMFLPRKEFSTFGRVKIKGQIERLETQYKSYEKRSLGELANEIRAVRSGVSHVESDNAVYIPKIGNSPVIWSLEDAKLKHHNYFQVVLKKEAYSEYVASFFRSELGKLALNSLCTGSFISHVNKRDIGNVEIALPSMAEQEQVVSSLHKVSKLQCAINNIASELALNPTSSKAVVGRMDSMMELIGALTAADKIRSLIRQGESKTLELKETLSLDIRKQTKEKYIETSSLKTIVAFLNTDGGILLVGVSDNGETSGLSRDIDKFHNKSLDRFLLHFKNLIKSRIGEQFYPYIDYRVVDVDGSQVLHVNCKPGEVPCYLDEKDFYVRANPATDKLEGPKLVDYVKAHFTK